MALYVTDTHALLWYLGGSARLSAAARAAFDEAASGTSQVIAPAIIIAELVMLAEKRRGTINAQQIIASVRANPNFRFTSLLPEIAANSNPHHTERYS